MAEHKDNEVVQKLIKINFEFKRLYNEHGSLENKLVELSRKKFVSAEEERKRKELQKKKLVGRDRMEQILKQYQNQT